MEKGTAPAAGQSPPVGPLVSGHFSIKGKPGTGEVVLTLGPQVYLNLGRTNEISIYSVISIPNTSTFLLLVSKSNPLLYDFPFAFAHNHYYNYKNCSNGKANIHVKFRVNMYNI